MKNLILIHSSHKLRLLLLIVFVLLLTLIKSPPKSHAQVDSSGVAVYVQIKDNNPLTGSLVSFSQNGYILSKEAYDPTSFAVIVSSPAASYEDKVAGNFPVVSQGKAEVRVS